MLRVLEEVAVGLRAQSRIEFFLIWTRSLLRAHGKYLKGSAVRNQAARAALRGVQQAISQHERDLFKYVSENQYTLDFVSSASVAGGA